MSAQLEQCPLPRWVSCRAKEQGKLDHSKDHSGLGVTVRPRSIAGVTEAASLFPHRCALIGDLRGLTANGSAHRPGRLGWGPFWGPFENL